MRVLFSGGGTGGHIYPSLAIAKKLEERVKDSEILFVGTKDGLEADIIPKEGYKLETIHVEGLPRKISLQLARSLLKTGLGLVEAKRIIKNFKPDIVVGTGGYVCGPTVLAASLSKVPTLIHEQNAYPGLTNRMLARVVDKIALSNLDAKKHFSTPEKTILTGNPIRPEILRKDKLTSYKELGLAPQKKIILVFGGSRGAKSINQALVNIYPKLKESDLQVLHITGKRDFSDIAKQAKEQGINNLEAGNIIIKSYSYNMEAALAIADLIISRAGATGLAEITACGIPSILVPYPHAAENHQEHNARSLERNGAAKVILDQNLTGEKLFKLFNKLIKDEPKLNKMAKESKKLGKPNAANKLVDLILSLS
ncbi:undecaprenyldiphospho-muramoylpentapeptide beta-N-acetylglucosaminyltransferase [Halobacteroides halobius DSM 5150]|uniref:UDP-N-acetylglucosamine--N-acetylmuramyl-(pentapeptide) pyrophosphoryl-undecaprenol N-acetylglucosamine transferase n=1 Tax=Halobacteroides halobius (strain ATCC 35273 / DSM 5150 / MD-1) TaxID=748449 RepID=L0KBE7_HALHC|nr:undecaprenyldiphospho-muramoylpentapeptide beta-N-acetylglucosaminyltransferase [Halobacteroides halobius]AGB41704.1 undecaprenyldiphospho-muramoylpentapeptide beta-N-acetylglucosaminyltransferase [Halobacteroides halobius DSM 5150]